MELINKEDAVALIKAEMDKIRTHSLVDGTARINLRLAKNIIEDMPTIDIVRCKDCKSWKWIEWAKEYRCTLRNTAFNARADDFCSYGERKE